jgi:hypothetical protein
VRLLFVPVLLLLVSTLTSAADVSTFNIPEPVAGCLKPVSAKYKISGRINPFYLRGDFDGDGRPDYVVLITNPSGERGIAICRAASHAADIIGAGVVLNKLADFNFDAWMVFPKGPVEKGAGEGPPPRLLGDAISIIWSESASALLYWDGRKFRWYQQGD